MLRTVILRFRDFFDDPDEDTISKHVEIIERFNYVWWGWWKKEFETLSILHELSSRIAHQPLEIGLFNSGRRRFYSTLADSCRYNPNVGRMRSPQREATPSYYRDSEVAAWFRLREIVELSEQQFEQKFGPPPVGEATLVVVNSHEIPQDINAQRTGRERITMPGRKIIHISDLHFGTDYAYPFDRSSGGYPLIDLLLMDLEETKVIDDVGLLVVSGDLTTKAERVPLLDDALSFLEGLTDKLNLELDHVVIAPGNHDIPLYDANPHNYEHEEKFRRALKLFYGKETQLFRLCSYWHPDNMPLDVLVMNSVKLRSDSDKNYGYLQWTEYDTLLNASPMEPNSLRIAVLHHHLIQSPREEKLTDLEPGAGFSTTLDSGAVIEGLQTHGFQLALHGHQHVPAVTRVSRGRFPDAGEELIGLNDNFYVVAGGSAGARVARLNDEMRDNTYSILTPRRARTDVLVRRFTPGGVMRRHLSARLEFSR
jgi:predicted MPP superfamily phosphohydrolase